jgi:hypothetical protein
MRFLLSGLVAGSMVAGIAVVMSPHQVWTMAQIASLVSLCLSVGLFFWAPAVLRAVSRQTSSDAGTMAMLAPRGLSLLVAFLLAAASCKAAMLGATPVVTALLIGWLGSVILLGLGLTGAGNFISATDEARSARVARNDWIADLTIAQTRARSEEERRHLSQVIEKVRFSASDLPGVLLQTNEAITVAARQLVAQYSDASGTSSTTVIQQCQKITTLLDEREIEMKRLRSRN